MKKIILLCLATLSLMAQSNIENEKQRMLSNIDQRIDILQGTKKCVQKAPTQEEILKCKENTKKGMILKQLENRDAHLKRAK